MVVIDLVHYLSRGFVWLTFGLEMISLVLIAIAVYKDDIGFTSLGRDMFKASLNIRNAALCLLGLLFIISNKELTIDGVSIMTAISLVCSLIARQSVIIFASSTVLAILTIFERVSHVDTKNIIKKIGKHGMWSMLLGFLLAYLLSGI